LAQCIIQIYTGDKYLIYGQQWRLGIKQNNAIAQQPEIAVLTAHILEKCPFSLKYTAAMV
jgi:hypothetical protein